jgi:hypothetical protein
LLSLHLLLNKRLLIERSLNIPYTARGMESRPREEESGDGRAGGFPSPVPDARH